MHRLNVRTLVAKLAIGAGPLWPSERLAGAAQADDHWDRHHDRDHRYYEHRDHYVEHGPVYVAPRPLIIAPPPVYQQPVYQQPGPSGLNLNFNIPLN